jgi:hypothetical protein
LWPSAALQGHVFLIYIDETYGQDLRNQWVSAMAGQSLDEASRTVLGKSFDDLNADWLAWLMQQL